MRALLRLLLPVLVVVAGTPTAFAQPAHLVAEAERIAGDLQSGTRLQRTLAAVALQHFVQRQSSFRLFAGTKPQWWQDKLSPASPALIRMLGDKSGLEWVTGEGVTEKTTTPGHEAGLALIALGRPAVEPLIDALQDPKLAARSAGLLQKLAPNGPGSPDQPAWKKWWSENRERPLPSERGRLAEVALGLLVVAAGVALVIWLQRALQQRRERGGRGNAPPGVFTSKGPA